MIFEWLKKRREQRNREIAQALYDKLSSERGWQRFLPPVAVNGTVYLVTEDGTIYTMKKGSNDYEQITQIHKGF